jgi:excisionase family DNA binding protein
MSNRTRQGGIDLTTADVAVQLGVSRQRVWALCAEGQLPHIRQGKLLLFPRAAWDRWVQERADAALEVVRRDH